MCKTETDPYFSDMRFQPYMAHTRLPVYTGTCRRVHVWSRDVLSSMLVWTWIKTDIYPKHLCGEGLFEFEHFVWFCSGKQLPDTRLFHWPHRSTWSSEWISPQRAVTVTWNKNSNTYWLNSSTVPFKPNLTFTICSPSDLLLVFAVFSHI